MTGKPDRQMYAMRSRHWSFWLSGFLIVAAPHSAVGQTLKGAAAFGDWRSDKPGLSRVISADDLPKPDATASVANFPRVIQRDPKSVPQAPPGFKVALFADGLNGPREIRVAPNGDIFIAETREGRVRILRAADGESRPSANEIFASGLNQPFGIAFFPNGNNPQWVYFANTDGVVRFHYVSGDLKASGKAELVAGLLPGFEIAQVLLCIPTMGNFIVRSTSATGWAIIWCRTMSLGCGKVRSSAGPGFTSGITRIHDISESALI